MKALFFKSLLVSVFFACIPFYSLNACAHCDTFDGPLITEAQAALEKGDVIPVLKWVKKEDEKEVQDAFSKAMAIRGKGLDVKEIADRYFLETLVRLHRASENEPYTGIKPAGTIPPVIKQADAALNVGTADDLIGTICRDAAGGIKEKFNDVVYKKQFQARSVDDGRAYVKAYVEYLKYVEHLHEASARAVTGER